MNTRLTLSLVFSVCALWGPAAALAQSQGDKVLVQGPELSITGADLDADALRMPPEMRSKVLARPQTVRQIASNLYARRVLARKAQQDGLQQDAQVQAALQLASDKVLSDAYLTRLDRTHTPTQAVAEEMARSTYLAKPERFQAPEEVRARHILISGDGEAQRKQAEQLLQALKNGGDFAQLAKEHSADAASAVKGGELGFFGKGKMVPEFEAAAFALKNPGDLSDVVKSKFGYHIIELEEHRPAGTRPYAEVREALIKEVQNQAIENARADEVAKLQQGVQFDDAQIAAFARSHEEGGQEEKAHK